MFLEYAEFFLLGDLDGDLVGEMGVLPILLLFDREAVGEEKPFAFVIDILWSYGIDKSLRY
jgi:hypothetical protein